MTKEKMNMKLQDLQILELKPFDDIDIESLEIFFDVKNEYDLKKKVLFLNYIVCIGKESSNPLFKIKLEYISAKCSESDVDTRDKVLTIIQDIHPRLIDTVGFILTEAGYQNVFSN